MLNFPFTAIVGQPLFKLALMLATINPAIGGVVVSGPRGSAKSTLARSLVDIAPVATGNYPFVTLPLGATEEMLVGTLNLQEVLQDQQVGFQEGLLAKAHGGILYVDEVNLLSDNLVDLLLDVAASGTNVIERDGISHHHDAQFLLMGTMNPDEGELRPQLYDRFGFSVELDGEYTVAERVAIVRLREAFDRSPQAFIEEYQTQQTALKDQLILAKKYLSAVSCSDALRVTIAERCQQANVDGVRADIVWYRAAVAHAALRLSKANAGADTGIENGVDVTMADIDAVETLVLAHRKNDSSTPNQNPPNQSLPKHSSQTQSESLVSRPSERLIDEGREDNKKKHRETKGTEGDWGQMPAQTLESSQVSLPDNIVSTLLKSSPIHQTMPNKTSASFEKATRQGLRSTTTGAKGKVGAINTREINWFSSLVANVGQWPLKQLRYRQAKMGQPMLHLILLDTSASTLQNKLLAHAKAAVLSIAEYAYLQRESLTVLGFGNQQVTTLLSQKKAPKVFNRYLDHLTAAGGTPLRAVLDHALVLQKKQYRQSPDTRIRTYLITDGRSQQRVDDKQLLGETIVIDTEKSSVKRGKGQSIARALGADYIPLFT